LSNLIQNKFFFTNTFSLKIRLKVIISITFSTSLRISALKTPSYSTGQTNIICIIVKSTFTNTFII
jgi:hypothetical protein